MPALTAPFETYEKPGIVISYAVAANTSIYKGGLVGVNAAGLVVPLSHTVSGLKFIGVANESVKPGEGKRLTVTKSGTFVFAASSPATSKIGSDAYAKSDGEVQDATTSLTTTYTIGTIVGTEMTSDNQSGYRIRIDNHTK